MEKLLEFMVLSLYFAVSVQLSPIIAAILMPLSSISIIASQQYEPS